jgi:hypothetical protein
MGFTVGATATVRIVDLPANTVFFTVRGTVRTVCRTVGYGGFYGGLTVDVDR